MIGFGYDHHIEGGKIMKGAAVLVLVVVVVLIGCWVGAFTLGRH